MIPKNLTYNDFLKAALDIDKIGIPLHRKSFKYFLIINGREYPPKFIITHAYELKNGKVLTANSFNAVEAKNYFINSGYKIRIKESKAIDIAKEDEKEVFFEGKENFRTHRSYERDTRVARIAKQKALSNTGELRCEVCNFSFIELYGELGTGYIEAHHKIPVSQLGDNGKTKIEDISLLCSNCHKMIHRSNPMKTVGDLKEMVKKVKSPC